MRGAARGLACAACLLVAPVASRATPPVWIATHGRSQVVLFGSVHLLPRNLVWTPPELTRAEARAARVWFEIPIDAASDAEANRRVLAKGSLPAAASLWSLLTPETAEKVRRAAAAVDMSAEVLSPMRPWLADISLSLRADLLAGARVPQGVERQVQAALAPGIERRAFKSAGEQIDFLADAPIADQLASLRATAEEILERPDTYGKVLREWLAADLDGLRREALDPLERASPTLFDRLMTARNRRWARLLRRKSPPGVSLVVVGMAHMIGAEGLPALLRAGGWTVVRSDVAGAGERPPIDRRRDAPL